MDFGGGGEVKFEIAGTAGIITLARPDALNALTHNMVLAIERALQAWETASEISRIVIRGEGRAFCAGGDIVDLYEGWKSGTPRFGFFADEYRVNAYIARYPKPVVSLYDGIVMGGGVGISVHGSHRVFTENAVFAMPEVSIGFFPDVGGSHFLPRLPGEFGMCMALTGRRVKWGDALMTGLATNAVPAERLAELEAALTETGDTNEILSDWSVDAPAETASGEYSHIAHWFGVDTVSDVLQNVIREAGQGNEFGESTLKVLRKMSPTSLAVAFRQVRAGAALTMDECMRMEFRIVSRMLVGHDFYEGIRAAVIDKDRNPLWQPEALEEIVSNEIDGYFADLGDKELSLS